MIRYRILLAALIVLIASNNNCLAQDQQKNDKANEVTQEILNNNDEPAKQITQSDVKLDDKISETEKTDDKNIDEESLGEIEPPVSNQVIQTGKVDLTHKITKSVENIETFNSEEFDKYQNKSASRVINDSTSINTTRGARGESIFSLRGFNQRQVPVLLDGVPIYIPFDGVMSLDHLPISNIKDIQIIKGGPSIQYGPNTLGGVINIVTQKPTKPFELKVRFNDNQVNTLNEDIYVGLRKKNFYFTFNNSFAKSHGFNMSSHFKPTLNESGGIRDNSAFHNLNIGGTLGYSKYEKQDYRLTYQFLSSPWDVPPEVGVKKARYWRFTKWRKNTLIASVKQPLFKEHLNLNGNFFFDKYYNILDAYDNNLYDSQTMKYAFHSTYDDHSLGFNIIPEINISKYVAFKPVFLYKRDVHKEIPNKDDRKEAYKASTTTLGGVIELYPTDKLTFEGSISADRYKPIYNDGNVLSDTDWVVNAQGGLSYLITENNKVYFNISRKTRFPTLKELYSGYIGMNIPNPLLEPETAFSYEVGYKNKFRERTEFGISLFRSNLNNLIVDVPIRPRVSQLQNISKALNQGIDVDFKVDIIKKKLAFNTGYSFLHAVNKSENRVNNYIEYLPKHKFYSGLTANLPWDITADFNLMYVSKVLYQDQNTLQWGKLGGYPVLNLSLMKKIKNCDIFVSLQNMLDKNYETTHNYPMPGISVIMGLKVVI